MYNLLPFKKTSGIILPLWAVYDQVNYGIGDLRGAYAFIDFLEQSGMCVWEIPMGVDDFCPYVAPTQSTYALDESIINIEAIPGISYDSIKEKLESGKNIKNDTAIHYEKIRSFKHDILRATFGYFIDNDYGKQTQTIIEFNEFVK